MTNAATAPETSGALRGEYKVPGGKMVAADVVVVDGRLASVAISGDFFLEPDDALERIDAALVGQPVAAKVAELTGAIEAALDDTVTLVGFTPESVAFAVRRALGHATSWRDHTFELIHTGPQAPALHVALDQVLAEELAAGRRGPTLRFWEWVEPAVVIGSFQSLRNEVDPEGAERHGITVVRRISGGGAMFMEAGNCITFSLVVPASLVDGLSFEQSYAFLDDWVLGALADVGVTAAFSGLNDIASPAGKLAGAAQKRLAGGAVLHHVTMAYDIDADKMLDVLRIGREKLSDKGTTSAKKRVDPVRSQTGRPRTEVIEAFKAYFRTRYTTVEGHLTEPELARAADLVRTKFGTKEWQTRVP